MSVFEVVVTPTRLKNAKKITAAREPTAVVMAPFSAKSIVTFEDIPITKTARRFLNIHNPTEEELGITVTKLLKLEYNVSLEWTTNTIPAKSSISMEITWSPLACIALKESIQLKDDRNFKKDVLIILKSIDKSGYQATAPVTVPRKTAAAKKPTKSQGVCLVQKKPKMKFPSPPQNKQKTSEYPVMKRHTTHVLSEHNVQQHEFIVDIRESMGRPVFGIKSPIYSGNSMSCVFSFTGNNADSGDKENCNPAASPLSISTILGDLNFTPAATTNNTATKQSVENFEYLASLPTPTFVHSTAISKGSREQQPSATSLVLPSTTPNLREGNDVEMLCDLATPQGAAATLESCESEANIALRRRLFNEHPNNTFGISPNRVTISPRNLTPKSPCTLTVIREEPKVESPEISHKTFNISGRTTLISAAVSPASPTTTNKDISLVGTPLRKKFQSLRDLNASITTSHAQAILKNNQGSMPNLNDINTMQSIDNNRYYYQISDKNNDPLNSSTSSVATTVSEMRFSENEILAQSSQLHINRCHEQSTLTTFSVAGSSTSTGIANFIVPHQKVYKSKKFPSSTSNRVPIIKITAATSPKKKLSPPVTSKRNRDESLHCANRMSFKISPPKRSRCDDSSCSSDSSFRSTDSNSTRQRLSSWSRTKAQKMDPHLLSFKKKQPEKRVILFDPEMHIKGIINPDPFAATTTTDPFLAATMYLDPECVDKHQAHFKKWLNALVTIPAELEASNDKIIDFGALFNAVRNKEVDLAQSREVASTNYFTKYRLEGLRRAAIKLYFSGQMRQPFEKLVVNIEKKLIFIRPDRDLHLDVVLQRDMLELLLCIHPLWLRLGLEVTFGEEIFMQDNRDIVSLSAFIVTRLFRDKYVEAKSTRMFIRSVAYTEQMKKHSLKKLLMLLFFLDTAKNAKIIPHDPCLFLKSSEIKDTRALLCRFSSSLLGNVGDITRDLRRIGIVLTHKQTYLDEFDYAFNNLAVDLRDGVRLTKVMEIILMREDLTCKLRAPAISRLQKVYNVDLALKALAEADFVITGSITAADIADGHREKSLSLLWQIIYTFQAPKFNAAAFTIQTWWRRCWLNVCIRRRIQQKREQRRIQAAITIQSAFRSYVARKFCNIYRAERRNACIVIQSCVRRFLARRRYNRVVGCVVYVQRWYRNMVVANQARNRFLAMKQAAIRIQRRYRQILLVRKIEAAAVFIKHLKSDAYRRHVAIVSIQQRFRGNILMKIQRKNFVAIKTATICIQRMYRGKILMRTERSAFLALKQQSIVIQQRFRANLLAKNEQRVYLTLKRAVLSIQQIYRATKLMQVERHEYLMIRQSSIIIQQRFRATLIMRKERTEYLTLKRSVLCIQNRFRAKLMMKTERTEYLKLKASAICIQRRFIANLQMKKERTNYLTLKKSTILIQQIFRATLAMRYDRERYLKICSSTSIIQRRLRATFLMRIQRIEYLKLKGTAICIQRRFRANLQMKKERQTYLALKTAATSIQQRYRATLAMRQERETYLKLYSSVCIVQRLFRANLMMQLQRSEFLILKESAICIQRRFRAKLLMRVDQENYQTLKTSAIFIQRLFRAQLSMKEHSASYQRLKCAAILLQRRFRANLLMKRQRGEYLQLMSAVQLCQSKFRANQSMKKERMEFEQLKMAAIVIQQRFRANILAKRQRKGYLQLKAAVLSIQQKYRATNLMIIERRNYLKLKWSSVMIQRRFRATLHMKQERHDYLALKQSVTCIQQRFRANLMMKSQQFEYLSLKQSVTVIQRIFRGNMQMNEARGSYQALRAATLCIQRQFRAQLLKNQHAQNYRNLKWASIVIQRRFRANMLMKKQRAEYFQWKTAIHVCQSRFRANQLMKKERLRFQQLKAATTVMQKRFRANALMMQARCSYLCLKAATIRIQIHYRALLCMRKERCAYTKLRTAAITIQRRFRARLLMHQQRQQYLTLKHWTIIIQRRYIAQKLMQSQYHHYQALRNATLLVQRKSRALWWMRKERAEYLEKRKMALRIQQSFRATRQMKIDRAAYLKLIRCTVIIQTRLRATLLARQLSNQFKLIKCLIICVQRKFRANRAMRYQRTEYLNLRRAVLFVQRKYRANARMEHERNGYRNGRLAIMGLQRHIRGYIARRKFEAKFTPEMREAKRQLEATRKIQAYWRGFVVRRHQSRRMHRIREKLKSSTHAADAQMQIRHRVQYAVHVLRNRYNITEVLRILTELVRLSREVPQTLVKYAEFIANFCYGIMSQAIRSEVDKQMIELCSYIILNLSRYEHTKRIAYQREGLVTIAQMLLRWGDKDCAIFNTLCSCIWVFAQCTDMNKQIREYMTTHEAYFMLAETKKLVIRKENMRRNKTGYSTAAVLSVKQKRQLPTLTPDFGLRSDKVYIFNCSIFAFDTILDKLRIQVTAK